MNGGRELHVVTTGRQPMNRVIPVLVQIHPFADRIHLREKTLPARQLFEAAVELIGRGVPAEKLIINDRADVAWAAGVGGVHLAWHSLEVSVVRRAFPGLRVGCSVHSPREAAEAEQKGADYVIYGHVFSTKSKPGLPPRGVNELALIAGQLRIPVIAIGGITPENAQIPLQAGAAGIAVMSGILEHGQLVEAARAYAEILKSWSE
jgi:thiazole tautomerase (transcriptional regulator TenI)